MFSSHGGHLTNAMYHHGDTLLSNIHTMMKQIKGLVHDSQIVIAKENLKLSHGGLKDLFSVVYAENTVPHMLSGKAIARAIRAHTLVELALHALMAADIFDNNRPDNNAADINEEESIDQAQDKHNRDEIIDAIITLDINEQCSINACQCSGRRHEIA